ncbi:FecR family protein [Sphingobacterium rhinopitheci]|uniref:FecR family protein n=1 Tax=Sphingobacterium rhinopitheci TaxID=2781960 RepID=UPI001F522A97|nr:FecR family protein [Sphingobacterium rhinopitheci]MCI0920887.1 FecR domain-containing protein [Sphingobacterium rhinopitheci]
MDDKRLKLLLSKYIDNTLSKSELLELFAEINDGDLVKLSQLLDLTPDMLDDDCNPLFKNDKVFEQIENKLYFNTKKPVNFKVITQIAATLLCIVGIYAFQLTRTDSFDNVVVEDVILPSENNATITLANGKKLPLIDTEKEILSKEGIELVYAVGGALYFKINPTMEKEVVYRTFNSAKGMQAKLIFSDGTIVLLNSDTDLTYPSRFSQDQRSVRLQGEAYFEVMHNDTLPFVVSANTTNVKVLGTTFNIATNIVSNKVLTTLVSGSVEVNTGVTKDVINPGVQTISDNLSGELVHRQIIVQDVLAWKEGYFRFNEDNIATVLDKIKSWYEIADYEIHGVSKDHFTGTIRRTQKLSDLFKQLEKISSFKFKIVERRVIVMS